MINFTKKGKVPGQCYFATCIHVMSSVTSWHGYISSMEYLLLSKSSTNYVFSSETNTW